MEKKDTAIRDLPPRSGGVRGYAASPPAVSERGATALMDYVEDGRARLREDIRTLRSRRGVRRH